MQFFFHENSPDHDSLVAALWSVCEGLVYISETDSPVQPFVAGVTGEVTARTILQETGKDASTPTEERDFGQFFERLTTLKDWYGDTEKARAKKYLELQKLLEENLFDLKVIRIGNIRLDIYALGLDKDGRLTGVSTFAVET